MNTRAMLVSLALVASALAVEAATTSDQSASILVYPYVVTDLAAGVDTHIQLTNTSNEPVDAQCFYEQVSTECVGGEAGRSCEPTAELFCLGECVTTPHRTPFLVRLTAGQPVAWPASIGLDPFPLDGVTRVGPGGQNNGASRVPGLGAGTAAATLRCITVGADSTQPVASDVLVGQATITKRPGLPSREGDNWQYRAIGFRSVPDELNDGTLLQLGGPNAEYEGCSDFHMLDHFLVGAPLQTGDRTALVETTLVLTPCGSAPGVVPNPIAEFFVYNEFGQRFSTSRSLFGQLVLPLNRIDTSTPTRSIFALEVGGTLAARTRITGLGSGLHVLAIETHRGRADGAVHSAGLEAHGVGERESGDALVLFALPCTGDCNHDGVVGVDEVVTGVGIGLGRLPTERCGAADGNGDGSVAIDEVVSSVGSLVEGCPSVEPPAAPTPTRIPTQAPTSVTPEITHFGLARADDFPLDADDVDDQGRPVFFRPFGQGFALIVEARPGTSRRNIGTSTFSEAGDAPHLQLLVSNPLGDGDPTVCEDDGTRGGVPAVPTLDFSLDVAATVAAMNDLGCRAYNRMGTHNNDPYTRTVLNRSSVPRPFAFVVPASTIQFAVPIARAWALPEGETIFAVRVRDVEGNHSEVREMVVRVGEL